MSESVPSVEDFVHVDDVVDVCQAADDEQARRIQAATIENAATAAATAARAKDVAAQIALEQIARVADAEGTSGEGVEAERKLNAALASEAVDQHVDASGAAKVAGIVEQARKLSVVIEAADAERERRVFLPAAEKLAGVDACRRKSDAIEAHVAAGGAAKVAGLIEKANNVKAVTAAAEEERERRVAAAVRGKDRSPANRHFKNVSAALKVNTRFKLAGNGAKARAKAIEDEMKRRQKENEAPKKTWASRKNSSSEGLYKRSNAPKGPRPPKRSWKDLP